MSQEEFTRYWIEEHTPFTAKVPGVRSYRCYPLAGFPGQKPPFDAVATLGFDSEEAWKVAEASPELATAVEDARNFQDVEATTSFFAIEQIIV